MRVFICGFGTVGQGFAETLALKRDLLMEKYGEDVRIVGVMDSRTYSVDENGLDPLELVSKKRETRRVGDHDYKDPLEVLDAVDYDVLV